MNIKHRMFWLAALSSALIAHAAVADTQLDLPSQTPAAVPVRPVPDETADQPDTGDNKTSLSEPRPAVVNGQNVNVRGQATIKSEVVSRLNEGDRVSVVEEIVHKKSTPGDPDKRYKIVLPKNTDVWVHSSYIDPDTKAVKASRLNMRSGPGENYSVLGRLDKGAVVKPLETKGDWIKIEPAAKAYAYVAASLVNVEPAIPPTTVVATEPPTEPKVSEPPAEVAVAQPPEKTTVPAMDTYLPPTEITPTTPMVEPVPSPAIAPPPPPEVVAEPGPDGSCSGAGRT